MKYYIETYGCTSNKSDSEIMEGILLEKGFQKSNIEEAEIIIINTCGVKKPTEDKILNRIKKLSTLGKKIIIAGCLPKIVFEKVIKVAPNFSAMIDPFSIDRISEVCLRVLNGEKGLIVFSNKSPIKPCLPKKSSSKVIGIIQIAEGCTSACSYCCVRFARGRLQSYPYEKILEDLRNFINNGFKEIWLTSQDLSAYDYNGYRLPELLNEINKIPGEFFIRVGMMNPRTVLPIYKELAISFKNEKIFKFLHLPIQSGSNKVLKDMNRGYKIEDFKKIVNEFRKENNNLTLSTDIIVGFPTEEENDFEKTIELIKEIKPDIINISKFFPRPKTLLEGKPTLPFEIIKKRIKEIFELSKKISFEKNIEYIGWVGKVLIDEKGCGNTWIGRNISYKPVVVESNKNLLGKIIDVEIESAKATYLLGKILLV
ncbi:MAG: tRNA (N(6)-L-threonylcarbamoyladenosine(37)-C(2))-methylthiotransferase [Nitrososphaerota archaeon]